MKKEKKNHPMRKLVAAVAMLALSSASLFGSTYAWFTMNKTVTLEGMSVRTTVSSNLLIAADTAGLASNAKMVDTAFKISDTQTLKAWLEPVSSNDAATDNFWYTLNALGSGAVVDDGYGTNVDYLDYDAEGLTTTGMTDSTTYANNFSEDYGVAKTTIASATGYNSGVGVTPVDSALGYVDYVFQLKAVNTGTAPEYIYLTDLTLTYAGATDGNKAFRAAVFMEDITSGNPVGGTGTLKAIYSPSGAAYQDNANGAASGANARTAVSNLNANQATTAFATVGAGATAYYKVVVRLWIEGEDTTCTATTFATLDQEWSLNLRWDLGVLSSGSVNGHTPVANLVMATTAAPSPEPGG